MFSKILISSWEGMDKKQKLFKLGEGPWRKMFSGEMQELSIELYANPDQVLLLIVFDQEKGKVKGAVVQLLYPFQAKGSVEQLVEGLPVKALVLASRQDGETAKYLFAALEPAYLPWKEEPFQKAFGKLLMEISQAGKALKDFAKNFEVELNPLKDCPDEIQSAFFAEPLLVPGLATKLPKEKERPKAKAFEEKLGIPQGVMVGVRKGLLMYEPIGLFGSTLVSGGHKKERQHLLHVLAENALFSHLALTVFEFEEGFEGLAAPTKKLKELRNAGVEIEPIGFPIKHFTVGQEVKVDINLISPEGWLELFGVSDKTLVSFIKEKIEEGEKKDLDELIKAIRQAKPSESLNQYQINKAARLLQLFDDIYPGLFGAGNNIKEVSKLWVKGIGRAGIIHLKEVKDDRARLMVIHSILKGIVEYYKKRGISRRLKAMVLLPNAERFAGKEEEGILHKELIELLGTAARYGVGFTIETSQPVDLDEGLLRKTKSFLTLVSGLDAAVKLEGQKQYRATIRPALSTSIEEEE